jgi:uncharacterized repeat protein (TIGR01451 family)
MPAAHSSGARRRRAPRVIAALGLVFAFAALGASGSAYADATDQTTSTVLVANPTATALGAPITLTATVTGVGGSPPGSVVFANGATPIGTATLNPVSSTTSQAVLVTSSLAAGTYALTATYNSSDFADFSDSTSPPVLVTVTGVTLFNTATTLTASPPVVATGQSETLTAQVSQIGGTGIPTGLVTFADNGVLLGQASLDATGTATLTRSDFLAGPQTITAEYAGDIVDRASSATLSLQVTTASGSADLSVAASAAPASVHTAGQITYSLVVANAGPQPALDARLTDQLPAGTTFVSVAPGSPTCAVASGVVSCSLGTIASGAQQTVTLVVTVGPGLAGTTIADTAQVANDVPDPNPANNTATATTPVRASADIGVAQSGPASVAAGGALAYTLTVTNAGPDAAAAVTLADTLPAGLSAPSATTTAGSCSIVSGTLSCALGTLASGGTITVTVAGTLAASTTATSISNTASASSSTDDPNTANNSATVVTSVTVTSLAQCPAVGSVSADEDFVQVVGHKTQTVHVEAYGDCDLDWRTGKIYLDHASVRVQIDCQSVLIDASQDSRHSDIARVAITGPHDAVITGTWKGTAFTVTLHDGGAPSKNDTVRVQYGSFDTSTLSAKHADVHIDQS